MAFKRMITLTCDGPCGTALEGIGKVPKGWSKVFVSVYEQLANGEKPKYQAKCLHLCPKCSGLFNSVVAQTNFAFQNVDMKET